MELLTEYRGEIIISFLCVVIGLCIALLFGSIVRSMKHQTPEEIDAEEKEQWEYLTSQREKNEQLRDKLRGNK